MLRHESWPVELPLRARLVDQQAALAGAGCVERGLIKATYGTGVFVLAHVGDERPDGRRRSVPTAAWRVAGKVEYALDGGVFTAGALLEWMTRDLGLADDPPALAALAAEVEDSDGVSVLPALAGMGAPWWRSDAHAVFAGMSGRTQRGHIARAALEAIAWRVADVLAVIAEASPVEVLRVDGGLTHDPLLLQLQADAGGIPSSRAPSTRPRPDPRRWRPSEPASGPRRWRSATASRSETASLRSATRRGASASTPSGAASSSAPPSSAELPRRDSVASWRARRSAP